MITCPACHREVVFDEDEVRDLFVAICRACGHHFAVDAAQRARNEELLTKYLRTWFRKDATCAPRVER